MMDKVGETFDGIISSVTSFGLFIELNDIFVEGLVHITNLNNDYYQFDPIRHRLRGEHSGKVYQLGDPIQIKVARVDLDERKIDFMLPEMKSSSHSKKHKKKTQGDHKTGKKKHYAKNKSTPSKKKQTKRKPRKAKGKS